MKLPVKLRHRLATLAVRRDDDARWDDDETPVVQPIDLAQLQRNENVVLPTDEDVRTQLVRDAQLRRAAQHYGRPEADETKEQPSCFKHGWVSPRRLVGQPPAPASHCPMCQAEWSTPKPTGPDVILDGGTPQKTMTAREYELHQAWLDQRRERGEILPNSDEELDAIAEMDAKRHEVKRERPDGQVVRYARSYGGPGGGGVTVTSPRRKRRSNANVWEDASGRIVIDADAK